MTDRICRGGRRPPGIPGPTRFWARAPRPYMAIFIALLIITASISCDDNPGPPAALGLVSATDIGPLELNPKIGGRDGGYSGVFNGRSVWLYGDTILKEADAQGHTWLNNSWSWTADLDPAGGMTGFNERLDDADAPTEFFPLTEEEAIYNELHYGSEGCAEEPCGARWAMWPGPIVADSARSRALIFYGKIHAAPGEMNFYGVGNGLVVWEDFDAAPTRPEVNPGADEPTLLFSKEEPTFGSAAIVVADMLYAYACDLKDYAKPCKVGRVPLADALDRSAWRFWDGAAWQEKIGRAQALFDGNDIMTVAWCPFAGVYIAIYSQPMDAKTMLRTAPAPEGPWSRAVKLFDAQKPDGGDWVYDALAHPEYAQNDGLTQYVTYSRSTGFFRSEHRVVKVELADVRSE